MLEQAFITPFLFVLGTVFGSFFGVLIDRLPKEKTILGRSKCDYCRKNLKTPDLIPVISFVLSRGKSRCCHKRLSLFYPFIEVLTGTLFVLTWILLGDTSVDKVIYLAIVSTLIVIFFADAKYQIIPDSMQALFFLFTLLLKLTGGFLSLFLVFYSLVEGLIVMLPILLLFLFTKGRGMGFGDVKLAFVMGFLLGWLGGLIALYIAFIVGAIFGIAFIVTGRKKLKSKIAFGPFLVIGTIVVLLFQESLIALFSRIYGI